MPDNKILHTDSLLRKHQLLYEQDLSTGVGRYVDWMTNVRASKTRVARYEAEAVLVNLTNAEM